MPAIKYRELKRRYDLDGPAKTVSHLREAIDEGHVKITDFSLRDLAEALVPDGREWVRSMDPRNASNILEASDGVDVTAFSNITGQLIYSMIMEAYTQEAFKLSAMVPNIPTRLSGERIPGIGNQKDVAEEVHPGMLYPSFGLGEDYQDTPVTVKRGYIVPVTKEAIFFDRTNLITTRAAEVGEILGLNKEKRLLDLLIGATNNYNRLDNALNTYSITGADAPPDGEWINRIYSNDLVDWTDVDNVEQLFVNILDPNTGEPVLIMASKVMVCPARRHAAGRVFNATELRTGPTDEATGTQTAWANPLAGSYQVDSSRLLYRRLIASGESASDAAGTWFVGDFAKALAYMENWPITVVQSPNNSEADFNQDIVLRWKASERGVAAMMNPRYLVRSDSQAAP